MWSLSFKAPQSRAEELNTLLKDPSAAQVAYLTKRDCAFQIAPIAFTLVVAAVSGEGVMVGKLCAGLCRDNVWGGGGVPVWQAGYMQALGNLRLP